MDSGVLWLWIIVQAPVLQQLKPALYAKCLQLLYDVAVSPLTCEPVFRLLHPKEAHGALLPDLAALLLDPLQPAAPGADMEVEQAGQQQHIAQSVHSQVGGRLPPLGLLQGSS